MMRPSTLPLAHRHRNGLAGVGDSLTTGETVGGVHGDAANGVLTQVLGDLNHRLSSSSLMKELVRVKAARCWAAFRGETPHPRRDP